MKYGRVHAASKRVLNKLQLIMMQAFCMIDYVTNDSGGVIEANCALFDGRVVLKCL
jgi:hypothetical protein